MKHCFFAVDLGATSGRTILGTFTPQGLELQDVNRFPNHLIEVGGHYYWDIYELYRHILEGLKLAAHMDDVQITSIGIDTWGVDFVCVGKDGGLLRQPYSYRDPHTMGAPETFFARVPRKQVYGWTGIQVMNFNSLFQLDTLRRNKDSALEAADMLAKDGVSAKVINIHTIKPLDTELVVEAAKATGKVVTVEEHSIIGGLGGAVCEALSEKAPTPVLRIGVKDVFGESGPAVALLHKYQLDGEGVYAQIKEWL